MSKRSGGLQSYVWNEFPPITQLYKFMYSCVMKSVSEFAELKGISKDRVYALIRSDQIPYRKVGNSLLIESEALAWSPRVSRSLSPRMALSLAHHLEGGVSDELRPSERSRVKAYARRLFESQNSAQLLSGYMAKRAVRHSFSVSADDISDLRRDRRLALSGVSAPISRMSAPDVVEGYVSEKDLPMLVQEYLLREAVKGNVILRVPSREAQVGPVFVAADLADWNRPREQRQARIIIGELDPAKQHDDHG